jgi:hypothetical protein
LTDDGCFHELAVKPPAGTEIVVDFTGGSTTFLRETLATGHVEATRWAALEAQLKRCQPFTAKTAKHAKVSVGVMSFPKVGTQSAAYVVTVDETGRALDADVVLFKVANDVGVVEYGGPGTPDVGQAEKFVDLAVAKIKGGHATTSTTAPPPARTTTTTTARPPTTTTPPPTTTTTTTAPPPPPTTVPPPPPTTAPSPPPTTAAPAGCSPIDDEGGCYEPGEYCRNGTHGVTGTAGDGEGIACETNDGWRWEPT